MTEEVKIKDEPVDPEYDKVVARIKAEPEDIPDNFFDDIENNEFLNELIDNVGENFEAEDNDETTTQSKTKNKKKNPSDGDGDGGANSETSDDIPLKEQIEKLSKTIERRKKKLVGRLDSLSTPSNRSRNRSSRSRSPSRRSSKRKRTTSRERIRSRSKSHDRRRSRSRDVRRSISRDRRIRHRSRSISKTNDRRSRSKGRRSRSIESRRRHRSRSQNRSHKSDRKMSFLDELEKIFAEKGQTFPEKDQFKRLMNRKGTLLQEIRSNSMMAAPAPSSYLPGSQQPPPSAGTSMQQPNFQYPPELAPGFHLPMPIQIKVEPVDYNKEINGQQNRQPSSEPMQPVVKRIKVEKEEETVEIRREKVLKMCTEALIKLRSSEENPLKTRFYYTPAVICRTGMDESLENRSPLNQINNVQYKFNSTKSNLDLDEWGLWKPSDTVSNVIRDIGFDVTNLIDKLSLKDISTALKHDHGIGGGKGGRKDGKTYTSFYTDSGTQTDEAKCSTCIIRQLRKFVDKGVQGKPLVGDVATQTEREDELPIMNTLAMLNSSQLIALNDFSDIIKSPAPTNATELYRLREKMMDIYNLSQRPCMMPAKFSTPQAPSFNSGGGVNVSVGGMGQYFDNGRSQVVAAPQMYSMQQSQFPFQTGPQSGGMMNPFPVVNMPTMHQTIYPQQQLPQPVPPPNVNVMITPRRDDPRHRGSNPPPAPRSSRDSSGSSSSSSGKTFGRGSKSFSISSRR